MKLQEGLSISLDSKRIPEKKVEKSAIHTITHCDQVISTLFSKATTKQKELIKNKYGLVKKQNNLLEKHKKECKEGILIVIPRNVIIEEPIQITSTYNGSGHTHILIFSEDGSSATINRYINEKRQDHDQELIVEVTEVSGKGNLTVNEFQNVHHRTNWYGYFTSKIEGELKSYKHINGGNLSIMHHDNGLLKGEITDLSTVWLSGEQQCDINVQVKHVFPKTKSRTAMKAVVQDRSKLLQRGLIIIDEKASESEGYQHAEVLTADNAQSDAIPKLEINNPNVICSHGATIGSIPKDQLHYLRTRGLCEQTAIKTITTGFLNSITEKIDSKWQKSIQEMLGQDNYESLRNTDRCTHCEYKDKGEK